MSRRNLTHPSPPRQTGRSNITPCLTGVTDVLPFTPMSDDRYSLVPLYARTGRAQPGSDADPTSDIAPNIISTPWTYDGPVTARARLGTCQRCRAVVLEGLVDGLMHAHVDPRHLTPTQELHHLLAGGQTTRLGPPPAAPPWHADRRRITWRWPEDIRAHPGTALPVHQCDAEHGPPDLLLLTVPAPPDPAEEPTW